MPPGSISLVVTDGASAMVAAHGLVRAHHPTVATAVCASHTIHNFFKDVGKIGAVDTLISKGQKVADLFKNREATRHTLARYSRPHLRRELGVVIGAETRFGSNFLVLHRLLRLRAALTSVVTDAVIRNLAAADKTVAATLEPISDPVFWLDVELLVGVLWPAMLLLRLLDSDLPVMGLVVHGWRALRVRLESSAAETEWGRASTDAHRTIREGEVREIVECLDARTSNIGPIHYAAYLTNPMLLGVSSIDDAAAVQRLKEYASTVFADDPRAQAKVLLALQQLVEFKAQQGRFNDAGALDAAKAVVVQPGKGLLPAGWWQVHGHHAPVLRAVAIKALSQVVSVGAAERGHKTYNFVQTKIRNRLASSTVSKLIVVHQSLRMQVKAEEEEQADADAQLEAALKGIDEWWAEEMDIVDAPGIADWATADPLGGGGRGDARPVFKAWRKGWEVERIKDVQAGPAFRRKYVGMRVPLKDEGEEKLWKVTDCTYNKAPRMKVWEARLVGCLEEGEGVEERKGQHEEAINVPIDKHLLLGIVNAAGHNDGLLPSRRTHTHGSARCVSLLHTDASPPAAAATPSVVSIIGKRAERNRALALIQAKVGGRSFGAASPAHTVVRAPLRCVGFLMGTWRGCGCVACLRAWPDHRG